MAAKPPADRSLPANPEKSPSHSEPERPSPSPRDLKGILDIKVPVTVVLAEKSMKLSEILALNAGSVVEFDKPVSAPLDLAVNNQPIASGRAVRVDDNLGIEITRVKAVTDTVRELGRRADKSPSQESDRT